MHAASWHCRLFTTYLGTEGRGCSIDFTSLPHSFAESITRATALQKSGRIHQYAKDRPPLDHDPVLVRFVSAPDMFPPTKPRLDVDLLGIAMKTGYRRKEFLLQVEEVFRRQRRHQPHSCDGRRKVGTRDPHPPTSRQLMLRPGTTSASRSMDTRSSCRRGNLHSDEAKKQGHHLRNLEKTKKAAKKTERSRSKTRSLRLETQGKGGRS